MIKHLQISKEGLAVFSQEKKVIVANNLFVQYANLISDEPFSSIDDIFEVQEFKQIFDFVDKNSYPNHSREEIISDSFLLSKNSKSFQIECILFQDNSFEISINNVTQQEEESRLKRQLNTKYLLMNLKLRLVVFRDIWRQSSTIRLYLKKSVHYFSIGAMPKQND